MNGFWTVLLQVSLGLRQSQVQFLHLPSQCRLHPSCHQDSQVDGCQGTDHRFITLILLFIKFFSLIIFRAPFYHSQLITLCWMFRWFKLQSTIENARRQIALCKTNNCAAKQINIALILFCFWALVISPSRNSCVLKWLLSVGSLEGLRSRSPPPSCHQAVPSEPSATSTRSSPSWAAATSPPSPSLSWRRTLNSTSLSRCPFGNSPRKCLYKCILYIYKNLCRASL